MAKKNKNADPILSTSPHYDYYKQYLDYHKDANVEKEDAGRYARRVGALSPDNPYRAFLLAASNSDDIFANWEKAIQWQVNQLDYQQQMQDAAVLREDERQYYSDQAVAARQRAAGLNPDLIAGSGGSAGSAGSVDNPRLASTDAPQIAAHRQASSSLLQADAAMRSANAQMISSIGNLALNTLNSIGNIATLGSQISSARSMADMQKLQLAQQVIPTLPYNVTQDENTGEWHSSVSESDVSNAMQALGLNYKDKELVSYITSTANNPHYRAFRFQGAYEAWKAENDYSIGLTMYRKTAQAEAGLKFYTAAAEMNMAYFNDAVSSMFSSDSGTLEDGTSWDHIGDNPYVLQAQEAAALQSGNSVTEAKVNQQALERAVAAFDYNVSMSSKFQAQIDSWISVLQRQDNTVENQAAIRSLQALKAEIGSYSADQFSQMYATFFKAAYNYSFRNAVGPKMTQGETALWGEQFDFIGTLFNLDRADHGNPVGMFVDFIKKFIPGFNISKYSSTITKK